MRFTGRLIGLFSFDVGYEIDLERSRQLTAPAETRALERRRAAPAHFGYTTPPLRIGLGRRDVTVANRGISAETHAMVHEFGAITITVEVGLETEIEALPALTASLASTGSLEGVARALLDELYKQLLPAIAKPGLNPFIEDYYILQSDSIAPLSVDDFLLRTRGPIASALRCEAEPLSESEIADVLRSRLSYYPDDLILTEWNVAFIIDDDYQDAANVLEHLNVELLELRHYDAVLDRHVADTYEASAKRGRLPLINRRTAAASKSWRRFASMSPPSSNGSQRAQAERRPYLPRFIHAPRTGSTCQLGADRHDKLSVLQEMYNIRCSA
jgi:hypothetical protein